MEDDVVSVDTAGVFRGRSRRVTLLWQRLPPGTCPPFYCFYAMAYAAPLLWRAFEFYISWLIT